jgi:hypothetical protein
MKTADERMIEIYGAYFDKPSWDKFVKNFPNTTAAKIYKQIKEMQAEIDILTQNKPQEWLKELREIQNFIVSHYNATEYRNKVGKNTLIEKEKE